MSSQISRNVEKALTPVAVYESDDLEVKIEPGPGPHSTNGVTTGPSDYIVGKLDEDKDKSSEPLKNNLGDLRAKLTTLQDKVNFFLTDMMKEEQSGTKNDQDLDLDEFVAA